MANLFADIIDLHRCKLLALSKISVILHYITKEYRARVITMLRLRQNLPPRVSNSLSVISAILLLIAFLAGNSEPMFTSDRSLNLSASAGQQPSEPEQESLPEVQTVAQPGFKISLMIFR